MWDIKTIRKCGWKFEFCVETVEKDCLALKYVPKRIKTAELCMKAVKAFGNALEYVPEELKTAELCLEAVKKNGQALQYVTEELRTAELCLESVKNSYGRALQYVPEELKTEELCLEPVIFSYGNVKFVPEHFKTFEFYFEAVKKNFYVLGYVPEHFKTKEICFEAVKKDSSALYYVPEHFKTKEICFEAVKKDSSALYYVPEHFKTFEFYLEAVNSCGLEFRYVPEHFKTLEFYIEVVKLHSLELENVPDALKDAVKDATLCNECLNEDLSGKPLAFSMIDESCVDYLTEADFWGNRMYWHGGWTDKIKPQEGYKEIYFSTHFGYSLAYALRLEKNYHVFKDITNGDDLVNYGKKIISLNANAQQLILDSIKQHNSNAWLALFRIFKMPNHSNIFRFDSYNDLQLLQIASGYDSKISEFSRKMLTTDEFYEKMKSLATIDLLDGIPKHFPFIRAELLEAISNYNANDRYIFQGYVNCHKGNYVSLGIFNKALRRSLAGPLYQITLINDNTQLLIIKARQ
jgi:hypothetical protein